MRQRFSHAAVAVLSRAVANCPSNYCAQAVDFVRKRLARRMAPQAICEAICDHCLAPDTQVTHPISASAEHLLCGELCMSQRRCSYEAHSKIVWSPANQGHVLEILWIGAGLDRPDSVRPTLGQGQT